MIWNEFLRHFASVMRKIAGYLRKNRSEKDPKSPKAHTKTDTSSQEKLFGEIQNSFLILICAIYGENLKTKLL
ncbi:hypothetical protein [Phocaeicola salanitronis]|uniref:hypothetical protein n=1 Tax=Phocaeicola salanitronis TaxID=376805 RepID=UPI0005A2A5BF|nr:hypothetical protein [Phocaeicola salanitronis]